MKRVSSTREKMMPSIHHKLLILKLSQFWCSAQVTSTNFSQTIRNKNRIQNNSKFLLRYLQEELISSTPDHMYSKNCQFFLAIYAYNFFQQRCYQTKEEKANLNHLSFLTRIGSEERISVAAEWKVYWPSYLSIDMYI